jgi:hypothetical protein
MTKDKVSQEQSSIEQAEPVKSFGMPRYQWFLLLLLIVLATFVFLNRLALTQTFCRIANHYYAGTVWVTPQQSPKQNFSMNTVLTRMTASNWIALYAAVVATISIVWNWRISSARLEVDCGIWTSNVKGMPHAGGSIRIAALNRTTTLLNYEIEIYKKCGFFRRRLGYKSFSPIVEEVVSTPFDSERRFVTLSDGQVCIRELSADTLKTIQEFYAQYGDKLYVEIRVKDVRHPRPYHVKAKIWFQRLQPS